MPNHATVACFLYICILYTHFFSLFFMRNARNSCHPLCAPTAVCVRILLIPPPKKNRHAQRTSQVQVAFNPGLQGACFMCVLQECGCVGVFVWVWVCVGVWWASGEKESAGAMAVWVWVCGCVKRVQERNFFLDFFF